jgi:thiamine kinase-like enzyme
MVINNIGFLVYPWIGSKPIQPSEGLSLKISSLLAKMHLIDLQVPELLEPVFDTNTNDSILELIKKAESSAIPFAKRLRSYEGEILKVNEAYQASIPILKEHVVVSHGDLDQKNILWDQEQIILIDWESARKLNPTYEIINASLDWSGITTNTFNKELFIKMIHTYCAAGGQINMDHMHAAFHGALGNWVNWMVYNIKRACAAKELDQKELGIEQVNMVLPTIARLLLFHLDICNSPSTLSFSK